VLITLPEGVRVCAASAQICKIAALQQKQKLRPSVLEVLIDFKTYLAHTANQVAEPLTKSLTNPAIQENNPIPLYSRSGLISRFQDLFITYGVATVSIWGVYG